MLGHRSPAFVVNAAVAEYLEILNVVVLRRITVAQGTQHAAAFQRRLRNAVHHGGFGQPGRFQDGLGDVDHVVKLVAGLAFVSKAVGPVHNGAVAGAAPVRGHLLGPLIRRAQGVCPADRVVVVGLRRAEVIDLGQQELGGFDFRHAVQHRHLVEGAVQGAFGRGAVVADDVVDQGVLEHAQVVEGVDEAPNLVVGLLEEAGVELHLAGQHRLQLGGHVVPGRDLVVASGQLRVCGHDA